MKSTKRNAAAAERNNANDMRRFLIAAQVITQKPIATTLENAVDNAVENEATTKGWLMAHQGAWDMAGFYAEEAGVSIDGFRKNMLKRHRGQFTKEAK